MLFTLQRVSVSVRLTVQRLLCRRASKVRRTDMPSWRYSRTDTTQQVRLQLQQDHQALLKAKYCPRVAAASCRQLNARKPCNLDL